MRNKDMIGIPVSPELKAELQAEAWLSRLTLAEYIRRIIERSRTPDGKQRVWAKMRKRGRPKRS
jgi:hypothetical protein